MREQYRNSARWRRCNIHKYSAAERDYLPPFSQVTGYVISTSKLSLSGDEQKITEWDYQRFVKIVKNTDVTLTASIACPASTNETLSKASVIELTIARPGGSFMRPHC